MQTKKSANVGQNKEFPIPAKEAALNERNYGGNTIPDFPSETTNVNLDKNKGYPRNTDGRKSQYPLQVSRPGERRV